MTTGGDSIAEFTRSFLYSVGQISLGLLVHPYQTMQSLVEDKVFVWMALLPTVFLGVVTVFWRYAFVPLVRVGFSCAETNFVGCDLIPFVSNTITFFMMYWQILLLYLLFRFRLVWEE